MELESASIDCKIQWSEFERLTLNLYESGNKFANDEYNMSLIKEGPKHLITLTYVWDADKYVKSNTEQSGLTRREK